MSLPVPTSFAGVDWGNFTHEVCAIIQAKVHQRSFDHSPAGLHEMVGWLSSLAPADSVGVALEVPHGPVVEALQDGGFPVYWAKTAIRCEPRSREICNDLRARGHRHERALRGLADRLLLRLVACLRDGRSYDPARWISREPASAA